MKIINQLKEIIDLMEEIKNIDMFYLGRSMNSIKNQVEGVAFSN